MAPFKSLAKPIRKSTTLLLVLLALAAVVAAQEAQETLTNEAVVRMVRNHLGADVIVEAIRRSPGNYSLNASSLIKLKQQGVPDKVIAAMQAKKADAASSATQKSKPSNQQTAEPRGKWEIRDQTDPLTGKKNFDAVMTTNAESNGRQGSFEVVATCDEESLLFSVRYFAEFEKDVGFKHNDDNIGTVPGGLLGLAYQMAKPDKPTLTFRLKIDDGEPKLASSKSDYTNEAQIYFGMREEQIKRIQNRPDSDDRNVATNKGLAMLAFLQSESGLSESGPPEQAYKAKSIKAQFTLANGDTPTLEIKPQEPSFKKFAVICNRPSAPSPGAANTDQPSSSPKATAATSDSASSGEKERESELRTEQMNAKKAQVQASQVAQYLASAKGRYSNGDYVGAIGEYNRALALDRDNQVAKEGIGAAQAAQKLQAELVEQQRAAGYWVDPRTRLAWTLRGNNSDTHWSEGVNYCQTLRTAGFVNWRIPTSDELKGIYDSRTTSYTAPVKPHLKFFDTTTRNVIERSEAKPHPYHIAGGIILTDPAVWSGTTLKQGAKEFAWYIDYGTATLHYTDLSDKMRVICVRPSQ